MARELLGHRFLKPVDNPDVPSGHPYSSIAQPDNGRNAPADGRIWEFQDFARLAR